MKREMKLVGRKEAGAQEVINKLILWRDVGAYQPERYFLSSGYQIKPSAQQIFYYQGRCNALSIRNQYGIIQWRCPIDISSIKGSLSQIIDIGHLEVQVYRQDQFKPSQGKQLNQQCLVTFQSNSNISTAKLLQCCQNNATRILEINLEERSVKVVVPHFTKYSFKNIVEESPKKNTSNQESSSDTEPVQGNNPHIKGKKIFNIIQKSKKAIQFIQAEMMIDQAKQKPTEKSILFQNSIRSSKILNFQETLKTKKVQQSLIRECDNFNKLKYNYTVNNRSISALKTTAFCGEGANFDIFNNQYYEQKLQIGQQSQQSQKQNTKIKKDFVDLCLDWPFQSDKSHENANFCSEKRNSQQICKIICDETYDFATRRLLALEQICFENFLHFSFIRTSDREVSVKMIETCSQIQEESEIDLQSQFENKKVNENKQRVVQKKSLEKLLEQLKDWFEWNMCNSLKLAIEDPEQIEKYLPSNRILWSLSLRRPHLLFYELIVQQKYDEAEIIFNLESQSYRNQIKASNIKIAPELLKILDQNIHDLSVHHWIIKLALTAWYCNSNSFKNSLQQIIKAHKSQTSYARQLRIFQTWLEKEKIKSQDNKKQPDKCVTEHMALEDLCSEWFFANISNKFRKTQSKVGVYSPKYIRYRYGLLQKMIKKLNKTVSSTKTIKICEVIMNDLIVDKKQKIELIAKTCFQNNVNIEQMVKVVKNGDFMKKLVDKSFQVKAFSLLNEHKYFQSLEELLKVSQRGSKVSDLIKSIATKPELLINYKRSIKTKLLTIFQKSPLEFDELIYLLKFSLGDLKLNPHIFFKIIKIFNKVESKFSLHIDNNIKVYILKLIEQNLHHNKQFIVQIKTNDKLYQQLNHIYGHSTDIKHHIHFLRNQL